MNEFQKERQLLARLGATSRPGSGNTLGRPEDGSTKNFLIQSKRTDKKRIPLLLQDVLDLSAHAGIEHKIPVFLLTMSEKGGKDVSLVAIRTEYLDQLLELARQEGEAP